MAQRRKVVKESLEQEGSVPNRWLLTLAVEALHEHGFRGNAAATDLANRLEGIGVEGADSLARGLVSLIRGKGRMLRGLIEQDPGRAARNLCDAIDQPAQQLALPIPCCKPGRRPVRARQKIQFQDICEGIEELLEDLKHDYPSELHPRTFVKLMRAVYAGRRQEPSVDPEVLAKHIFDREQN